MSTVGAPLGLRPRGRLRRDAGSARQQGREPRRDDPGARLRAGTGRLHGHDRGVRRVHARRRGPRRARRRGRRSARRASSGAQRPALRRPRRSVAGLGPLGRPGVDAGDARHDAQPRAERACVEGLARRSGNPRFAWDSRRRLVQMFAEVVRGAPAGASRTVARRGARREHGVAIDHELGEDALRALVARFLEIYSEHTGEPFPEDPREQLRQAILAVFDSWNNERAATYRRLNGIPAELGTAVTVQRMVFGNMGERSGSGVAFTRDPTTGAAGPDGDFLLDAQGEDVVAGVRNTETLDGLAGGCPRSHAALLDALDARSSATTATSRTSSTRSRTGASTSSRPGPPSGTPVPRFASPSTRRREGLFTREEALLKIDPASLDALMHPAFDPGAEIRGATRGVAASPGAAKGAIVFSAAEAERARGGRRGRDPGPALHLRRRRRRLPRRARHPHLAGRQVLPRGDRRPREWAGPASAAPPRSRSISPPAMVRIGERELRAGDTIAIDGATRHRHRRRRRAGRAAARRSVRRGARVGRRARRLGVRANADTAEDAARARELGAEGIGLCRTEHMFFGADREALVRDMFIAGELARRERAPRRARRRTGSSTRRPEPARRDPARRLRRAAGRDGGLPVTIRLLDPPLHEFIGPSRFERELRGGGGGRRRGSGRRCARAGSRSPPSSRRSTRCSARAARASACTCAASTRCRRARSPRRRSRWRPRARCPRSR